MEPLYSATSKLLTYELKRPPTIFEICAFMARRFSSVGMYYFKPVLSLPLRVLDLEILDHLFFEQIVQVNWAMYELDEVFDLKVGVTEDAIIIGLEECVDVFIRSEFTESHSAVRSADC
jgi:hypothetical protein